jgi:hypothetical protein
MTLALYVTPATDLYIRYIDGKYDLIMSTENPIEAQGTSCDQDWAATVQKENLIVNRAMAKVMYGIPDEVDVIFSLDNYSV